jgi:Fic family protein
MMTLKQFSKIPDTIPIITSWYLTDLAESRGKQALFTQQAPQRLKVLREHALIESSVSSNRIEGINVNPDRLKAIILGKAHLRDRDEEEVRGYRNALKLIHEKHKDLDVTRETILKLHYLARGESGDAGRFKERNSDIIEKYPDGRERVRFRTVDVTKTVPYVNELTSLWNTCLLERWVLPLIAMAGFNLDFLCIHPFRDGNGRVSRLLMLLQCYHLGFEVGKYISLERLIEQNKERYYETLEQSSQRWHEGSHDPWPYINFVLFILKTAYKEFEERVGQIKSPRGTKTEMIEVAVNSFPGEFTLSDLEKSCPGVSRDMIRRVLGNLQKAGKVKSYGRGPGAFWKKKG